VVELRHAPDHAALRQAFIAAGAWIRPFGNIVYLTPAFVINPADLRQLTETIYTVLKRLSH
jgi:adenosylmethionine-8-amino-7-oxononanoate aminotransferase